MVGLAGEGQNFDGNGPYIRAQTGGGAYPVTLKPARTSATAASCSATRSASRSARARLARPGAAVQARRGLLQAADPRLRGDADRPVGRGE